MNPNPPENYSDDVNPADKLQEIQTILTGHVFRVFTNKDKEYEYLEEGCYCITLENVKGNPLYIDLTDEFTLTYRDWHCHYDPDQSEYEYMLKDLKGLLNNTSYVFSIYSKNRWIGSMLLDYELASTYDIKKQVKSWVKASELIRQIRQDGAEVRFFFWDEDRNKVIHLELEENI